MRPTPLKAARALAVAALAAAMAVPMGLLTLSPASAATTLTPILKSTFSGSFDASNVYQPAAGEILSGSLTKSGNTQYSPGLVTLNGGYDGLSFTPTVSLGASSVQTSVAMEAVVQRTAGTSLTLDTVLALAGGVDYRWGGSYWRYDMVGRVNQVFVQQASAAPTSTAVDHVGLVYTYISDTSARLDLYLNGCSAGSALTNPSAASKVVNALGFGKEVHPSAPQRGFHGKLKAIAAETFTGTFSGPSDFQLPSGKYCHVNAGYLTVGLDAAGSVNHLVDSRSGTDYISSGRTSPLVSLVVDGTRSLPTKVVRTSSDPDTLTFSNASAGWEVDVQTESKGVYTTLKASRVQPPAGGDVQSLLWGPLPTSINQTVGQVAGVVRDGTFAIGLKPLTDRTEGAWPKEYPTQGWSNEVIKNPYGIYVESTSGGDHWSSAGKTSWGSVLRAFTFDYTKKRNRVNPNGYAIPVGPLATGGSVVGSKIALFGASPDLVLTVLSATAKGEGLPYMTVGGQWQKTAQGTSKSFLLLTDTSSAYMSAAVGYAKQAGLDTVYDIGWSSGPAYNGPWVSAGHNQFESSWGGSDSGAAAAVSAANAQGVDVGVHTLSSFVSPNDSYVTSQKDKLAYGQSTTLSRPLAATDTTLYLTSSAPLAGGVGGKIVRIGNEFITYTGYTMVGTEAQVTGLTRGHWASTAAAAATGASVDRVIMNSYNGALGGLDVIKEMATRFATIRNTTGLKSNSFDGLEGASESGWGAYGMATLVNGSFAQTTDKDDYITETSRMGSNIWDTISRVSWGEPGVTGGIEQLIKSKAYYDANYLAGGTGWVDFNGTDSVMSLEKRLSHTAGLDEGADLRTTLWKLQAAGANGSALMTAVKQWETARNLGAFTAAQKAEFVGNAYNWHLTEVTPGKTWSLQKLDANGAAVGSPQVVTAPTPAFTTASVPAASRGDLYAAVVDTNTPATTAYTVTSGTLPPGLTLNKDTGGITGIPGSSGTYSFTITATSGYGQADTQQAFSITVS